MVIGKSLLAGHGIVLMLLVGCGSGPIDKPAGTEGGPCYGNGTCDSPLRCDASKVCVMVTTSLCEGVSCSGHGTCAVDAGIATCTCDDGYQADGLTCVASVGPVISDVSAQDITQTTAKISWTLSEPATGQVEYGTTTSYGQASTKETSYQYTTHVQPLSGLFPATLYHFRVRSSNLAGVEAVSGDYTFTTIGTTIDPCAGQTCSDHGTCAVNAGNASCVCDDGYHADGLTCIAADETGGKLNGVWLGKQDLNPTMLKDAVAHKIFNIYLGCGFPNPSQYPSLTGIVPASEIGIHVI